MIDNPNPHLHFTILLLDPTNKLLKPSKTHLLVKFTLKKSNSNKNQNHLSNSSPPEPMYTDPNYSFIDKNLSIGDHINEDDLNV